MEVHIAIVSLIWYELKVVESGIGYVVQRKCYQNGIRRNAPSLIV